MMTGKRRIAARWFCLLLAVAVLFSLPLTARAWDWQEGVGSILGGLAKQYLPSVVEELGLDAEYYEAIEEAVVALLNSDWYCNTTLEEKIALVARLLETFGIADADMIIDKANWIISIELDGQTFGILLQDLAEELFDVDFWEEYEYQPEIRDDSRVNGDALILYGLDIPKIESALQRTAESWSQSGLNTKIKTNVTVNDFKYDLSGYDLIVIEEHGNFEWKGVPMIVTQERYTRANAAAYDLDIRSGRIYPVISDGGTAYWIHPSFFQYYYPSGQLDNTVVWLGSCCGAKSVELTDAFLQAGASAVVGYSEIVYTAYDYHVMNTTICQMVNGDYISQGLQIAMNEWGRNDREFALSYLDISPAEIKEETAYPRMYGNGGTTLR